MYDHSEFKTVSVCCEVRPEAEEIVDHQSSRIIYYIEWISKFNRYRFYHSEFKTVCVCCKVRSEAEERVDHR